MKPAAAALCAALSLLASVSRAGDLDVTITSEPKRLQRSASDKITGKYGSGVESATTSSRSDQWGYHVTIQNAFFNPLQNLTVKYMLFYRQEKLGQKGDPIRLHIAGVASGIQNIEGNGQVQFDTTPVTLTKSHLNAGSNGGRGKAEDSLEGLWIRIYQGPTLFAEYANPPNLKSREQWSEQPTQQPPP